MRIPIALNNPEIRGMLAFAVESQTGEKPFEAGTEKDSIQAMADRGSIRIVVCEYPGISDLLSRHIASTNRKRSVDEQIKTIICSTKMPEGNQVVQKMNILGFSFWARLIDATTTLLSCNITSVRMGAVSHAN